MQAVKYFVIGFISLLILTISLNFIGLVNFGLFAPANEQVRYNTFKNSQAYNDGMVTDLYELEREYLKANSDQKDTLKELILHRFAAYPENRMPPDLQNFYENLKGQ